MSLAGTCRAIAAVREAAGHGKRRAAKIDDRPRAVRVHRGAVEARRERRVLPQFDAHWVCALVAASLAVQLAAKWIQAVKGTARASRGIIMPSSFEVSMQRARSSIAQPIGHLPKARLDIALMMARTCLIL